VAYDIDTDYAYLCTHLAVLIASVGGDEEAVETMTHDALRSLIGLAYSDLPLGSPPYGGAANPLQWTPSQIASSRVRHQKYTNARKFIFYRDLLQVRMA
jgi:hypothetical protein